MALLTAGVEGVPLSNTLIETGASCSRRAPSLPRLMGSLESSGSKTVGVSPSTSLESSEVLEVGEVSGAQLPADVEGTEALGAGQVHLESASGKEPVHRAFFKKVSGFAELAEGFLEARRRRDASKPASSSAFRLSGQRAVHLVLLALILVHCISLLVILKKTIADVAQLQKLSVGAQPEEAEQQQPVEELSLALPIDDGHMDKYERQLGTAARLLQEAWLEADPQTQQIFARLFTPGNDVAGALHPFLRLEKTVRLFKRPPFADLKGFDEQLQSRWDEGGADGDRSSSVQEGSAATEVAAQVQDELKQRTELSKEDKGRADAAGQPTSSRHGLKLEKGAIIRENFESYVRRVIAANRLRSPGRKAEEDFGESEEDSEFAGSEDDESGEEYDLSDIETQDLAEEVQRQNNKQAGAHVESAEEVGVERKSMREEITQGDEELKETEEDAALAGGEVSVENQSLGEAPSNTEQEGERGSEAFGEDRQAREAEKEGGEMEMKLARRAVKERLVREANESRKVYAARLKLVTALMRAARRRIQAIGVSLSFVSQHRVSSPLYGLRGDPMPFLETLKRKLSQPVGYSRLYEQLQDRIYPAPQSDAPDAANVPVELVDRLVNAVRLSDLLIEQDQGVAASFNHFFSVVRTNKDHDEEGAADFERLGAGSRLPMDPGGHVEFPVALFRGVVGNLNTSPALSFITDETIRGWSENWTLDYIWAQTYKLCDAERERTAALHRIKQSLRKSWSEVQGGAVGDDDVFSLALYLL
ncbi:hypothetical protein ACSSS7_005385 [Eimeria intestinalis]